MENGTRNHHWPQQDFCTLGISGRKSKTPNCSRKSRRYKNHLLHPPFFPSCPQSSGLSITATTSIVTYKPSPSFFLFRALLSHCSNAPAGSAHSIPLKVAYLAQGVADTPLHHFHSSECSRRSRSRIPAAPLCPKENKHSTCQPDFHRTAPLYTPFSAQALLNHLEVAHQATWNFIMRIFHIWVSALFGSTTGDTAGVFIPFPMGDPSLSSSHMVMSLCRRREKM